MRLSTKGRYAVMAMTDLARHGADRAVSLAEIAARQEISLSYLEQLFARMRRGGLVKSVRGPGGGYRLARPAAETSVAEIVVAVDEPPQAVRSSAAAPSTRARRDRDRDMGVSGRQRVACREDRKRRSTAPTTA